MKLIYVERVLRKFYLLFFAFNFSFANWEICQHIFLCVIYGHQEHECARFQFQTGIHSQSCSSKNIQSLSYIHNQRHDSYFALIHHKEFSNFLRKQFLHVNSVSKFLSSTPVFGQFFVKNFMIFD